MARTTDEEFEAILDGELAWRRTELHSLLTQLTQASRSNPDSPVARGLSRSLATLLYAHWEGYTKAALDAYLKLILRRRPRASEAADGLLIAHASQLVRRMDSGDMQARSDLSELARGSSTSRLRLTPGRVVNTESNLRHVTLEKMLDTLNLPGANFETKKNLIDVLLCDRRNSIAHGRNEFPTTDEIAELHQQVLSLLEEVRNALILAVRTKSYLCSSSATPEHAQSPD